MRSFAISILAAITIVGCCFSAEPETVPPGSANVEPVSVYEKGRYRFRIFELKPGDVFETERGGTIKLSKIGDSEIVLDRTYPGWIIPTESVERSIGNWEYIKVVSIAEDASSLRLELRTMTKKRFWEAFSF